MCETCSKHFLYVASVKKHIQNLHPEVYAKIKDSKDLEKFCRIIKNEVRQEQPSVSQLPGNEKSQLKSEIREEIKSAPNKAVREEVVKPIEELTPNPIMPPYYPSMQQDLLPMPYSSPFFYSHQNYSIFRMVQPTGPTESAGPQSFWMKQLANSDKQYTQTISNTESAKPPELPKLESYTLLQESNELLAKASMLPTYPLNPLPQNEHNHIHCEFCGHTTIRHNDHIDYIHNAELHYKNADGNGWRK